MIAPSEDQFWTDMREGQMKLKIRVRRMKESRDMRGLSASRLLSFRWGRRGKRGLLGALLCLGDGDCLCQVADGEWSAMAGDTKSTGSWRAGRWRRAESMQRGSHGQCAEALAEAASLVLQAAAGKELHGGGSSFRQVRGCCSGQGHLQRSLTLGSFPIWCRVR